MVRTEVELRVELMVEVRVNSEQQWVRVMGGSQVVRLVGTGE